MSESEKIQESFWDSFNKVANELTKVGIKIEVPENKILKQSQVKHDQERNDQQNKQNDYLEIGDNHQPIYLVVYNNISNLYFNTERIDNYKGIHGKPYLKDNLLKSLNEIKNLEKEYSNEFDNAFSRAVKMYLDSAAINLIKPMNDWHQTSLDNAIIALKLFKSIDDFEKEYLDKILKLKVT
jgi:hypothetical protein